MTEKNDERPDYRNTVAFKRHEDVTPERIEEAREFLKKLVIDAVRENVDKIRKEIEESNGEVAVFTMVAGPDHSAAAMIGKSDVVGHALANLLMDPEKEEIASYVVLALLQKPSIAMKAKLFQQLQSAGVFPSNLEHKEESEEKTNPMERVGKLGILGTLMAMVGNANNDPDKKN